MLKFKACRVTVGASAAREIAALTFLPVSAAGTSQTAADLAPSRLVHDQIVSSLKSNSENT